MPVKTLGGGEVVIWGGVGIPREGRYPQRVFGISTPPYLHPVVATEADSTHPTGIFSCISINMDNCTAKRMAKFWQIFCPQSVFTFLLSEFKYKIFNIFCMSQK